MQLPNIPNTFSISRVGQDKWIINLKIFIAPILVIYLTSLLGTIQVEAHVITLGDFVPNTFVKGSITAYILNALLDYARKLIKEA